jgi:uncharacterized membrane protein YeaQ/YmgE (transglycosylase-associated protein family)
MNWTVWLAVGLIAGVGVGYVVPGRASRTPLRAVAAPVAGLAGGAIGGWLANWAGLGDATNWLGALLVAGGGAGLVLLALHRAEERRR